ncbi:MAG: YncE family protein [Acidobacteria bacterium]|nr:YncE family protein [Acidobacteriota bacterium]
MNKAAVLCVAVASCLCGQESYRLLQKLQIPGDYGWDYLTADSEQRRLYVSHDREVVVVDLDKGTIIGKIPGQDVHGIAVAHEFGKGFISASDPGSVTIFDLKTLAVTGKTTVGDDPNAIFYDRKTKRVFTIDRGSKRITALDAKSGRVVGSVEGLGGRTEHAVSDEAGHIFLNMQSLHTLLRVDIATMKVTDTWPLAPCQQPSSMDIDRKTHRLFIGCRNGLMAVVDATSGRIITTQPIGPGVDASEFDIKRGLIYFSSGGDGTMAVFHQDSPDWYSLVERVKTQTSARTMAVDQKTGKCYLAAAQFGPRPQPEPGKQPPRAPMIPASFTVLVYGR